MPGRVGGLCQLHHVRLKKFGAADHPHPTGTINENGYRLVSAYRHVLGPGAQGVHRLILFDVIGYGPHRCAYCSTHINWRTGLEVDHVDHDRLNNVADNLVASCHRCNSDRSIAGRFTKGDARSLATARKSADLRRGKPRSVAV